MGADIDVSKFLHPIDLMSPVEAAMRLHESRENEKTQRMFAQSQMARQSAQDFRDERDHREKEEDKERQRKIDQATALGTIQQIMRQPGGVGPASALGSAYGININPLTATTAAANQPPPGDVVDQFLARNAAAPGTGGSPGPEALMGPDGASAAPPPAAAGPSLPEPLPGRPIEGPVELGGDPLGNGPPQPVEGPMPAPPVPRATPADIESLMSRAAPQPTPQTQPAAAPMNPLYEAVLGGKHYPISTEQPTTGLGDKYEAVYKSYLSQGAKPADAFKAVLTEKEKDDAQAATEHRMMAVMDGRNDHQDQRDSTYRMTVEDQQARDAARLANAQKVARIRAAAEGATDPKQAAALAHMLEMKEQGAQDSEIAAYAGQHGVQPKTWNAPVKNVESEAVAGNRSTERRAGMEFQSADGSVSGVAASPQEAAKLRDKESKFSVVKQRMNDLIEDVKAHGNRVDLLSPDQIQNRLSMGAAVNAALRPYNGLGGTDASQKLESDITGALGTPGHGYLFGANPTVLNRILREAEEKHARDIKIGLRSGGGTPLSPALTHQKPPASSGPPDLDSLEAWSAGLGKK